MSNFISESEVYTYLAQHGFDVPIFQCLKSIEKLNSLSFIEGEEVVLKAEIENVFHKSDIGLVKMISFNKNEITQFFNQVKNEFPRDFKSILIVKKIKFKKIDSLPSELFFSIRYEDSFGYVGRLNFGGIHSEFFGKSYPAILLYLGKKPEIIFEELNHHPIGDLLLGKIRQTESLLPKEKIHHLIASFLNLIESLENELLNGNTQKIELIEINPFVVTNDQKLIPLDGVGTRSEIKINYSFNNISPEPLLSPKSIGLIGVSSKKENFGNIIFKNLKDSNLTKEQLIIIKDGEQYDNVTTLSSTRDLISHPVDHLLLAVPPLNAIAVIEQICEQGSGASIISLVAGGIGDGADHNELGINLKKYIYQRKLDNKWTPRIIGPNSLGTILSPLHFNSLFIQKEKLNINFSPDGNLAFISQSGAFFITRLSHHHLLPIKYAFCVGNQIDLGVAEVLDLVATDPGIRVISMYIEGFRSSDLKHLYEIIKRIKSEGKIVIIYKGGRSTEGAKAAQGHTGAMAGTYLLEKNILQDAGAIVCKSMEEFENKIEFYSHYADFKINTNKIGIVTNAGFEAVCSADILKDKIVALSSEVQKNLNEYFNEKHIAELVSANNPLDLTPMANEEIYLGSIERIIEDLGFLVVSIVPQSDNIKTNNLMKINEFGLKLKKLEIKHSTPIILVIDSGEIYNAYRNLFKEMKFIVLNSIEKVVQFF